MKFKQLWQSSLLWVLLFWCILSLIYHSSWVVVTAGMLVWVIIIFFTAPGVFWNYISHLSFNPQKKEYLLAKAVSYKPQILQPYVTLAMIYARKKRWPETVTALEQAIRLANPRSGPEVKVLLAISYRESGNDDQAVELLNELTKQGNKSLIIYINLASSYIKLARFEEALVAAEKARSFDLKATQPVLLMGRIHFELHEFQKAKDDYEWSIKHLSWPVESYYWLGRAELELGEPEAAINHLKMAVEKIKDDPDMSDVSAAEAEVWLKKVTPNLE
jgi:tetratricopeptide (TPR) repeat protein